MSLHRILKYMRSLCGFNVNDFRSLDRRWIAESLCCTDNALLLAAAFARMPESLQIVCTPLYTDTTSMRQHRWNASYSTAAVWVVIAK